MADFEAFMTAILRRAVPDHPLGRIRTLAREFAEGALAGVWGANFGYYSAEVEQYLIKRWQNDFPSLYLLMVNGFLASDPESDNYFFLTEKAFHLVEETPPSSVFISYKRSQSSTFALLVLARLKEFGVEAFVDMSIQPGTQWQTFIKEQIQARDYVVALLAPDSLKSVIVQMELTWAIESQAVIIPIWHGGFQYQSGMFDISPTLDEMLQNTHTIRVLEESAIAYNSAIIELLNRFGISP